MSCVVPTCPPLSNTCSYDIRRDGVAYIVVVAESVTGAYFTSLIENELGVDDPPPVCVAPSTGRFEVRSITAVRAMTDVKAVELSPQ